jgi:hypothetical protein
LVGADDASVSLRVVGEGESHCLEFFSLEDCAKHAWVHLCGYLHALAHIVDADAAVLPADISCDSSAPGQEVGVTLLKEVELGVSDYFAKCHAVSQITSNATRPSQ